MTADTKKGMTNTSTKTKPATEPSEPSKSNTPKIATTVVRRPAMPSSAETTTPKPDAEVKTKPTPNAATTAKAQTYERRMRELAPIVRLRRKLQATVLRFSNIAGEVKRWKNAPDLGETASKIETTLAAMLTDATTMPDSFQPERDRKGHPRQLVPGLKVLLSEKVAMKYVGILEPEAASNLEIVSVSRAHVSVKTAAGALIVLPRGHVTRIATMQAVGLANDLRAEDDVAVCAPPTA